MITINTHRFNFKEFIKDLIIKSSDVFIKSVKNRFKDIKIKYLM